MVRIRLARINRRRKKLKSKNFKSFRIVVVDSRKKRDSGDILADLGYYIPSYSGNKEGSLNGIFFKINDQELFEKWLINGAKISDSLSNLIKRAYPSLLKNKNI